MKRCLLALDAKLMSCAKGNMKNETIKTTTGNRKLMPHIRVATTPSTRKGKW